MLWLLWLPNHLPDRLPEKLGHLRMHMAWPFVIARGALTQVCCCTRMGTLLSTNSYCLEVAATLLLAMAIRWLPHCRWPCSRGSAALFQHLIVLLRGFDQCLTCSMTSAAPSNERSERIHTSTLAAKICMLGCSLRAATNRLPPNAYEKPAQIPTNSLASCG
jgi:hypothetical protein